MRWLWARRAVEREGEEVVVVRKGWCRTGRWSLLCIWDPGDGEMWGDLLHLGGAPR